MMRKTATRNRTTAQLANRFGLKLEQTILRHTHLAGVGDCFAILVCGLGKGATARLINPWRWDENDLVSVVDSWLINPDEWGNRAYEHSSNIHEMARAFQEWIDGQSRVIPQARLFAFMVAHPEGASTLYYRGDAMKQRLVDAVATMAEERFG